MTALDHHARARPLTHRIPLDVTALRARLEGGFQVDVGGGARIFLDHVEIDTGSSYDLLVHPDLVEGVMELATPTDPVQTLGGEVVSAWTLEVALSRPADRWERNAVMTICHLSARTALLGLPILRQFDILLRRDPRDVGRPALEFTPLR